MLALQGSRLIRHGWWNVYTGRYFRYLKLVIQVFGVLFYILWSWQVVMLSFISLDWQDMDGEILIHVGKLIGQQVGTSEV